jgi:hypothetical protein
VCKAVFPLIDLHLAIGIAFAHDSMRRVFLYSDLPELFAFEKQGRQAVSLGLDP